MSGPLEQTAKEKNGDDSITVVCTICKLELKKTRYLEPHILQVHKRTKEYECLELGCTVCYFAKFMS